MFVCTYKLPLVELKRCTVFPELKVNDLWPASAPSNLKSPIRYWWESLIFIIHNAINVKCKQTDNVSKYTNIFTDWHSIQLTSLIMNFMFGISLFVLVFYVRNSSGKISQEDQEIIRKWMPTYWLHSEEASRNIFISHKKKIF